MGINNSNLMAKRRV